MNPRERILALAVLAVVIVAGGGVLFKFLFWDPLSAVYVQTADANQDILKKQAEKKKEEQDHDAIVARDPRLSDWQRLSLPDDKNQQGELQTGRSLEDIKKRHEDLIQVEYERFLSDLVVRSGFAPNTIKVSSAPADRKGGPILAGKTPAYTRMSFTVQGQAGLDAVVRMLEDFHRTPLLHEIRNLTLTSRTPARGDTAGGRGDATGRGGDLDVNFTAEALLVTGAEKRDNLLPDSTVAPPHVLAEASRHYADMLAKNLFTGIAAVAKLTEDRAEVLSVVKLTAIWNDGGRWEATIYDQGKGGSEKHITGNPYTPKEFSVKDKYDNVLVQAKVIRVDEDGVFFQVDKKCYRWRCGEFLGPILRSPLKDDEMKQLGLTIVASAAGGDSSSR